MIYIGLFYLVRRHRMKQKPLEYFVDTAKQKEEASVASHQWLSERRILLQRFHRHIFRRWIFRRRRSTLLRNDNRRCRKMWEWWEATAKRRAKCRRKTRRNFVSKGWTTFRRTGQSRWQSCYDRRCRDECWELGSRFRYSWKWTEQLTIYTAPMPFNWA